MTFSRAALSQTGTRTLALALLALLGCAQDDSGTGDPQLIVGDKDAEVEKPDDQVADSCEERAAFFASFVATHQDCTVDADCAIIGSCSDANFRSIRRDAAEQGAYLMQRDCETAFDGPTYNAVCVANKCERTPSGASCGQAPQSDCPDGTQMQEPGCSPQEGEASFTRGCYASCSDDTACAPGFSCQATTVNPCVPAPGSNGACAACGAHGVKLCLPAPDCEVELAVSLGSERTVQTVTRGGSTDVSLWLRNRTDRALTLAFDVPCPGPTLSGLGAYVPWMACAAGACPTDPVATTVTLAPGEKLKWRSTTVEVSPSLCNPSGLPKGRYAPSFTLPNLTGAKVCGAAPVTLISGSATN
ncbi:MAG: hypothetical protein ABW252_16710 [Polyangiales bacterium]